MGLRHLTCALVLVAACVAACKDKAQPGFKPPPEAARDAAVAAVVVDAANDPAYTAELDRRLAVCVAADLIRDVDSMKITGMIGVVIDAWLEAPPEVARTGIAAIVDAGADLREAEARVRLYARAGAAYLTLDQREPAGDAFNRARVESASVKPIVPGMLDDVIDDIVEGLARLGEHAAVDQALVTRPAAAAAAAIGYGRAGDRARAAPLLERALAAPRDRAAPRRRLATALALDGRAAAARALWADAKPAAAARDAVALAKAVVRHAAPDALPFIDDAETAVSRANDLESHERAELGLELADLRRRAGDPDGAARRRAGLTAQVATLGNWKQMKLRSALAELALEAGDVAAAERELVWGESQGSLAKLGLLMVRVRLALHRGDIAAATEPLYTEALAPGALGYAHIIAVYRKRGTPTAASDELLIKRACP